MIPALADRGAPAGGTHVCSATNPVIPSWQSAFTKGTTPRAAAGVAYPASFLPSGWVGSTRTSSGLPL